MSRSKKNIVIVGGGTAGVHAAKSLSRSLDADQYQLVLINPLPYRVWLIASLRLAVSPQEELKEITSKYDKILSDGEAKFVQGTVTAIESSVGGGGSVTLESGEKIQYHVLLLSQGSKWKGPPGFPRTENGVKEHVASLQNHFDKARNIVIAGGGAVGYELAGEIKDIWPTKKVTIVHGGFQLFNPAYPAKMRHAAEVAIRSRGVEVILNDYVDNTETSVVEGVTTRFGKQLRDADYLVQASGPRPNTSFVAASLGADSLSDSGFILVRPTLQLKSHDDIFAAGDVIEWKEQKQSIKAAAHGDLVAKNILAFLKKGTLKPYKGSYEIIVVTNGKNSGMAYIDILWGITLGPWFARMAKSKTLLIPLFKSEMGY